MVEWTTDDVDGFCLVTLYKKPEESAQKSLPHSCFWFL